MKKDFTKHLVGTAGEMAVANMLCLQKWVPSLTTNNCPVFDIFCFNPENHKTCTIQVKTTKDEKGYKKNSFAIGITHNQRSERLDEIHCPYVFVHIDIELKHRFFVLSATDFKMIVVKTDNEYFYRDRNGKELKETYPIALPIKDLLEFENKWENIWL